MPGKAFENIGWLDVAESARMADLGYLPEDLRERHAALYLCG